MQIYIFCHFEQLKCTSQSLGVISASLFQYSLRHQIPTETPGTASPRISTRPSQRDGDLPHFALVLLPTLTFAYNMHIQDGLARSNRAGLDLRNEDVSVFIKAIIGGNSSTRDTHLCAFSLFCIRRGRKPCRCPFAALKTSFLQVLQ